MQTEKQIQSEIIRVLNNRGLNDCRVFKNMTGFDHKKKMRYGIPKRGGSDLLGWVRVMGTAVFLAIEVKKPIYRNRKNGGMSDEQINWMNTVLEMGGIAFVVYSADEVEGLIEYWKVRVRTR